MKTPPRSLCRGSFSAPASIRIAVLTGLLAVSGALLAADPAPKKKEGARAPKAEPVKKSETLEKSVVTGSLIPQKVKPGRTPATATPVVVISAEDIARSGESTVIGVIRKQVGR